MRFAPPDVYVPLNLYNNTHINIQITSYFLSLSLKLLLESFPGMLVLSLHDAMGFTKEQLNILDFSQPRPKLVKQDR